MKRYLLFAGDTHYPAGGWQDFRSAYDTLEEAQAYTDQTAFTKRYDWWQIVDTVIGEIIKSNT